MEFLTFLFIVNVFFLLGCVWGYQWLIFVGVVTNIIFLLQLSGRASELVIGRSQVRLLLGELGISFPELCLYHSLKKYHFQHSLLLQFSFKGCKFKVQKSKVCESSDFLFVMKLENKIQSNPVITDTFGTRKSVRNKTCPCS